MNEPGYRKPPEEIDMDGAERSIRRAGLVSAGYAKGVEGRALGMALAMMPTIFGYLLVLVLLGVRWF